jgi:RND family efflux transporter MFP subunit
MTMLPCVRTARSIAAAGVLVAALAGCERDVEAPELPVRAIRWDRVSTSLAEERRVISGIVTALADTRLAFEVAGTVQSVHVSLGDLVQKDQPLARLDPEPFELGVREAEAALAEAKAQLDLARVTLERVQRLAERDAARPQEVDVAVAERDLWYSQAAAADARLNLARRNLRRSVLTAPFRSKVSVREIDPAMKVSSGQTVFEIDSEGGVRVEVRMPETLIARVRQGDAVEVSAPSLGDQRHEAVVSEVGTRAGIGNAFPVRADLLTPPPQLRPGMTAEVTFSFAREARGPTPLEGFMIPVGAAYAEAGDRFSVFVYDRDTSTVIQTPIEAGGIRDNELAVLGGLEAGDIIATAGVTFLRDGQEVTLLDGGPGTGR